MLICPVCGAELQKNEKTYRCKNSHSFDTAKEGYVNLLTGNHKAGELIGDNKDMAKARRLFLETGHYDFLAEALCEHINKNDTVLDISCGEGYYTDFFRRNTAAELYGFDISKEMIKLAAKKYKEPSFFVANIARIPLKTESIGTAIQICAPFAEKEFARILKKDGILISVVPGKMHLWGLKEVLYNNPYQNNEDGTEYELLKKVNTFTVKKSALLSGNDEIMSLFAMTPYFYKTSDDDKQKLNKLSQLATEFEFTVRIFTRR